MMKKLIGSTITALLLMIILASSVFAAHAASGPELLLKGSWDAVEIARGVPPNVLVSGSGSANATQLGLYTVSYQLQINVPPGFGSGFSQFVAANGDTLFAAVLGQSTPTGTPNVITIVEQHTITGGTGRFEGAGGVIIVERVLNRATGVSSGTISGTIELP
jgi:hypothetical protein